MLPLAIADAKVSFLEFCDEAMADPKPETPRNIALLFRHWLYDTGVDQVAEDYETAVCTLLHALPKLQGRLPLLSDNDSANPWDALTAMGFRHIVYHYQRSKLSKSI